ncbi:MAG TPA: hypothetical protein VJ982_10675 [Gemmatimonadota bacterium]|nr:hypothetical protein [Gemmatimonadota bacterium]
MTKARPVTGAWAGRLTLAATLLMAGAGSARAQSEPPVQALLETGYLLSVGEVVEAGRWRNAEAVVGAAGETMVTDRSQTPFDLVHVPRVVEGRSLVTGDVVQFFRLERRIDDPVTDEALGTLLLPTGVGRVESLDGETAAVRVTDAFHAVLVGDRVRVVNEADMAAPVPAFAGGAGGRIVAFQEEKAIHPPFDKLFLRPDAAGSTAPGQIIELYRPGPVREGVQLPDVALGKAMVVREGGTLVAAVTYELERADLAPGDLYRPVTAEDD